MVAQALGEKMGVHVIIGQTSGASTDGKTIYLPALPLDDKNMSILANGFIDHESGHVRLTDMSVIKKIKTPFEKSIWNILEDIRIEKAMSFLYPGCKTNLNSLVRVFIEDGSFDSPKDDSHPAAILESYLSYRLRADVLQQTVISDLADRSTVIANKVIPKGAMTKITSLMYGVEKLSSTHEVLTLAREIITSLNDEIKKEKEKEKKNDDNSKKTSDNSSPPQRSDNAGPAQSGDSYQNKDDKGDDSKKQSKGDSNDKPSDSGNDSKPSDKNDDESPQQSKGDSNDKSTGNSGTSNSGTNDDDNFAPNASNVLKKIIDAKDNDLSDSTDIGRQIKEHLDASSTSTDSDGKSCIVIGTDGGLELNHGDGKRLLANAKLHTSQLRLKLNALVSSHNKERVRLKERGLELSTQHIHRVATNDPCVFKSKRRHKAVNTAISILLDRSTSMRDNDGMKIAKTSVLALAHALELIKGVSISCSAFPGTSGHAVMKITDFGQSPRIFSDNFDIHARGCTPMSEAMWWAATKLSAQPEPRKIMLVVTDGEPNGSSIDPINSLINLCQRTGIECMALGIGSLQIADSFPTHTTIHDMNELTGAIFEMMKQKLLQNIAA